MAMKKLLLAGVAALLLSTGIAHAASFKANKWANFCTSKSEREVGMCGFYALGLLDGLILWKVNSADPISICVPEEPEKRPNAKQIIDVGLAYIQKNPESNYRPIAAVLREAFEEKWPCIGM
jgi:Rap1a immunity proteins